jgi:hypothetical protein
MFRSLLRFKSQTSSFLRQTAPKVQTQHSRTFSALTVYSSFRVKSVDETCSIKVSFVPPQIERKTSRAGNDYGRLQSVGSMFLDFTPQGLEYGQAWTDQTQLRCQPETIASILAVLEGGSPAERQQIKVLKSHGVEYNLTMGAAHSDSAPTDIQLEPVEAVEGAAPKQTVVLDAAKVTLLKVVLTHALPHLYALDETLRPVLVESEADQNPLHG